MWPGTDIENVRSLKPGDQEVGAFTNSVIKDSTETVKQDGALTSVDGVEGGAGDGGGYTEADGGACEVGEEVYGGGVVCHFFRVVVCV